MVLNKLLIFFECVGKPFIKVQVSKDLSKYIR